MFMITFICDYYILIKFFTLNIVPIIITLINRNFKNSFVFFNDI